MIFKQYDDFEIFSSNMIKSLYHVIIVPGNPGLAGFYHQFSEQLQDQLGDQYSVTVLGYKGQTQLKQGSTFAVYQLKDQIEHIELFVQNQLKNQPDQQIILIGHSIGAYMCIQVAKKFKQVKQNIFLMPFLESNFENESYKKINSFLIYCWPLIFIIAILGQILRYFPISVRQLLIHQEIKNMRVNQVKELALNSMLSFKMLMNYLFMGRSEFINHSKKFEYEQLKNLNTHILYTNNDKWAPLQCYQNARKIDIPCTLINNVSHAFVENQKDTKIVVKWTSNYLKNKLNQ